MSTKLATWISNEFDRNAWFFAEFRGGLLAACDFIDYVINEPGFLNLDDDDRKYIAAVRESYCAMQRLSVEMVAEIAKYKAAYKELLSTFEEEEIAVDLSKEPSLGADFFSRARSDS